MFNFNKKNTEKDDPTESSQITITLDQRIEAILFFQGETVSLNFLVKHLSERKSNIKTAIIVLKNRLENSALSLIENNNSYLLTTKSTFSTTIEKLISKEEDAELSKPALETLAIILYKNPISKAELDEIRGINSSYILRNLLIRGLIEKQKNPEKLNILYTPTIDLLRFLGVEDIQSLPAYQEVLEKIQQLEIHNSSLTKSN